MNTPSKRVDELLALQRQCAKGKEMEKLVLLDFEKNRRLSELAEKFESGEHPMIYRLSKLYHDMIGSTFYDQDHITILIEEQGYPVDDIDRIIKDVDEEVEKIADELLAIFS